MTGRELLDDLIYSAPVLFLIKWDTDESFSIFYIAYSDIF